MKAKKKAERHEIEYTEDDSHHRVYRVEASLDGLRVHVFDPADGDPAQGGFGAYMAQTVKIPKDLVVWFAEAVSLAASRSPLFP